MTYEGPLDIGADQNSGVDQSVTVTHGLTVTGANGLGPGVINLGGAASNSHPASIYFSGAQTLDNVTVNVGAGTLVGFLAIGSFATVTLGTNCTLDVDDGPAEILGAQNDGKVEMINNGDIVIGGAGDLSLVGPHDEADFFTNKGVVRVESGGAFTVAVANPSDLQNLSGHTLTG